MIAPVVADLRARQGRAIEQSGWGVPFRLVQPANVAFWVYLAGSVLGAVALVRFFSRGGGYYDPALGTGVLFFAIYLVPWLLLLHHQNRYTSQPAGLLATAFGWGAVAAPFWIALPANTALLEIWTKVGGTAFASRWAAGLTAPIDEEFGKAIGLLLLLGLAPRLVRSAYDGFIIGAFIGLGFEVVEDVLYDVNLASQAFGVGQVGIAVQVSIVRGLSGIASHALFSAIFCAGLMWVLTPLRRERRVALGIVCMLTAMVFHFAWDDAAGLAGGTAFALVLPIILVAIEIPVLFLVARRASRTERAWMRAILAPEAEAGVIDEPLLTAASGLLTDRRRYRRRLRDRRRARHLLAAAVDLARAIAASGGAESEGTRSARLEIARLTPGT